MDRQFKFRAWHEKEKVMLFENRVGDCFNWFIENQPVKIMQYTGLKDKNGRDVFQGDIYRVAGNKIYEIRYIEKLQVQSGGYETYAACFVLWISEEIFFPFDEFSIEHGKVIGNIYENPELLKNG